jgi:hypothetical protein
LVLNPETPASVVAPLLHKLDAVVIMMGSPGASPAAAAAAASGPHPGDLIDKTLQPAMDKLRELVAGLYIC